MKKFEYELIDSTNEEAKRKILAGESGDFIIIANGQAKGKGRKGREFYSPVDTGIYMSYVNVYNKPVEEVVKVTCATAVIVRNAIKEVYDKECGIKWVNDLYYEGRKVCGILCECILPDAERSSTGIIVGIGINISTSEYPEEIANKAGSLGADKESNKKKELIDCVSEGLRNFFCNPEGFEFIEEYCKHSVCIGREVVLSDASGSEIQGKITGFTDEGYLILEKDNSEMTVISSGEISVIYK